MFIKEIEEKIKGLSQQITLITGVETILITWVKYAIFMQTPCELSIFKKQKDKCLKACKIRIVPSL